MRLAVKTLWVACLAAIPAGCTLALPLDYLQEGEGGSGPTTTSSGPTTSTMSQTSTTGQGGVSGGGGSPPLTYSETVLEDDPVLYFRMSQDQGEPNLGSLGTAADGTHTMPHAISASVLASDASTDAAATYDDPQTVVNMVGEVDSGALTVPSITPFFGADQPLTLELWLRLPLAFGVETSNILSVNAATGGLRLRIEANALNGLRFGFHDAVTTFSDYESVCYFDDWTGTAARHFVAVYDPTQTHRLAIYMDGVRCDDLPTPDGSQVTGTYPMPAIDGALSIGTGWSGDIDEVALYPTVLPMATICAHYALGSGLACP